MPMVEGADEYSEVGVGAAGEVAHVSPFHGVMTLTPGRWTCAAGPDASAVSGGHRPVLCGGEEAFRFAVLQDPAFMHQRGDDVALAEQL
ncbi:MAG: hypothetical protein JWQ64_2306, partial [Subtercola sp.]|nr:hypothetical protein [Subtercola sp.]